MSASSLIYPMAAMVLLSVVALVILFRSRVSAVRSGQVPLSYFRVLQGATEPEFTAQASRHFVNLFEAPTLFYAGCLAAMVTGITGAAVMVLAWGYVAARAVHTFIHLGGNRIRHRMRAYFVSWIFLVAMWVFIVVGVATRH